VLKRINYTDRRRIPRNQIAVKVDQIDPASFTIDLPEGLVADAATEVAYVDITSAGSSEVTRHRLECRDGRLARGPYPLGRIPWRKAIFDVKVVAIAGEHPGRILRRASRIEGKETGDWVLIDAGDVIVHVFRPEVREFYQLEKMWMPTGSRIPAGL
jgi:hypothetical protein